MTICTTRTMTLAALALGGALAAPAPAQSEASSRAAPTTAAGFIDVDFRGGTIGDYVAAVRRATPTANVMLAPAAVPVPVQPVELRQVTIESALELLEGEYEGPGRQLVEIHVRDTPGRQPGSAAVYRVEAELGKPRRSPPVVSSVWSLAEILDAGAKPDDVMTAIEAALELFGDERPAVRLRFHRETKLLIARGDAEQVAAIDGVLGELLRQSGGDDADELDALRKLRDEAEKLIDELRDRVEALEHDANALHRARTESETRTELLQHELDKLQGERASLRDQVHRLTIQRDAELTRAQMEIASLQKQLESSGR